MPIDNPVFVIDLAPDEALALRAEPSSDASLLVGLLPGQLVARLDEDERDGWWHVFADTPGEGAFMGYLLAAHVRPYTEYRGPVAVPPADGGTIPSSTGGADQGPRP
jgi:hypothetical protein